MATVKPNTNVFVGVTLTADAADTVSDPVVLNDGYGAGGAVKITNSATAPTAGARVQPQIKQDAEWYNFGGAFVAGLDNFAAGPPEVGVYSFPLDFPIWVKNARLVAGSNTDQDVTITADITEVSAIT